ncbi:MULTISPECIES: hypothetical protein [Nocardiopsis]|uniref:DUF2530 domain-containing protein n=1 Tax=Nocardiopsis sinuspersici TaxID=501010 RepID=A0A7Y9XD76_9ACTN|nr:MULTISPECIES: hypothetical protein [Nocardiopsis]NYH52570.1 hypothetical protein [Nocardiopsis sinuspersici]
MTTKTAVLIAWGTMALALISVITGTLNQGTAWWVWVIWAGLATGVGVVHLLARRAGLM